MKPIVYLYFMVVLVLTGCYKDENLNNNVNVFSSYDAQFKIVKNNLYLVKGQHELHIYNLTTSNEPIPKDEYNFLNESIKSIFSSNEYLIVNTSAHLIIFEPTTWINSIKAIVKHPINKPINYVLIQDSLIYASKELELNNDSINTQMVEISSFNYYDTLKVINRIPLQSPQGLCLVDSNLLVVCQNKMGIKVFNVTNPNLPWLLDFNESVEATHAVSHENYLVTYGPKGASIWELNNLKLTAIKHF